MADLVTVMLTSSGTWRVPGHVSGTLKLLVAGGGGGDYDPNNSTLTNRGGIGGWIRGDLDIARGTVLTIGIGGRGDDAETAYVDLPLGGGGPRPGGNGGLYGSHSTGSIDRAGAGGGGGTELLVGSTIIAVAGGGGGGGTKGGAAGSRAGNGAQQTGSGANGTASSATSDLGQGGRGGTTSAAGAGGAKATGPSGAYLEDGDPGSSGAGGDGGSRIYVPGSPLSASDVGGGGGGGGGYYGAGGGGSAWLAAPAGRGGGGSSWSNSSYVTEGTVASLAVPVDNVQGFVVFEFEPDDGWVRGHAWG